MLYFFVDDTQYAEDATVLYVDRARNVARQIRAGNYEITFSYTGYEPRTRTVQLKEAQTLELNIQLGDADNLLEPGETPHDTTARVDEALLEALLGGKDEVVVVTFEQDYRSNNLTNRMNKRQYWIKEDGRWKIVHEDAA